MHIPEYMMEGRVCPVTAAACAVGVAAVAIAAARSGRKPDALKFAAVSALIFAAQMMNFPVQDGTSGHFLGTTLAVLLLGAPFGILSMVTVVTVQCLAFADGGLSVLGANLLNMAFVGALPAVAVSFLSGAARETRRARDYALAFAASWLSVTLAASACSLELAASGAIGLSRVFPAMVGVHALIGICEALGTVALLSVLPARSASLAGRKPFGYVALASAAAALALSPFASSYPDGLEWVAERYAFLHSGAPRFVAPLADYAFPLVSGDFLATGLAGLAGVAITFAASFALRALFREPLAAR